jgi:hypothetical protein
MSDPRDYDQRPGLRDLDERDMSRFEGARSANAMWGWIAGVVFLVIVLALIFAPGGGDQTTQQATNPPAATTGSGAGSPPAATTPRATPAPAPSGQGSTNR